MVTKTAHDFLEALAEELSINRTRYDQAYGRYHALSSWLDREDSSIKRFEPAMYVQGSFALGTVIKPSSEEEYDVDMVCELNKLSKSDATQEQLKKLLGVEIETYRKAQNIQKPLKEGRRCWTLNYSDGAQFHMDVIPAIPNVSWVKDLLVRQQLDTQWSNTAIGITDNEVNTYRLITNEWPRSNPKGYVQWFRSRMSGVFEERKAALAKSTHASVEDIPDYHVITPLQSAIMILKHHRDIMFENDEENKSPISIIITTLAGHSYNGELRVSDALYSILEKMDRHILWDGQKHIIPNPSDPSENFADKWQEYPERREAFFQWLTHVRENFNSISTQYNLNIVAGDISPYIGRDLTERSISHIDNTREGSLLNGVSLAPIAPVSATPSFGDEPRVSTKPKGFA